MVLGLATPGARATFGDNMDHGRDDLFEKMGKATVDVFDIVDGKIIVNLWAKIPHPYTNLGVLWPWHITYNKFCSATWFQPRPTCRKVVHALHSDTYNVSKCCHRVMNKVYY